MDSKNKHIKKGSLFHSFLFVIWTVISTTLYAMTCIILSLFTKNNARKVAQAWNTHLLAIGRVKLRVIGKEKLSPDERYVFFANHQSALDIPALYSGLHHAVSFIAKKELFMIPLFGWGLRAVGHTWIDRSNARNAHKSIQRAVKTLHKEKVSLILFPEGTRSEDGKLKKFKTASFSLAIKAGVKIVPVTIIGSARVLPKKSTKIIPGEITLKISEPVDPKNLKGMTKAEISSLVRDEIEKNLTAPTA
ncbi:1-acyl-sn-glycerol-3-phosphate acyltransferase [Chitinispirillum alkaliphilum]|nr:1-acyl-sn-glycerol-3-phosphate acyltransferase [Chitinispirillum alkaliphilum]